MAAGTGESILVQLNQGQTSVWGLAVKFLYVISIVAYNLRRREGDTAVSDLAYNRCRAILLTGADPYF